MKTMRALLGCGLGLMLWGVSLCEGAPSLSVTKPPVQLPTLMTGPPVDPTAAQGQWFVDTNGVETVRTNEFHDETAGGLGANAITGYVDNVVYAIGPGTPILGFSIQATIHNDTTVEIGWAAGSNSHGELRPRIDELPYVGPLVDVKLAAEFAIGDTNRLPLAFNYPVGPYREGGTPFIEAINEDQWGWYCWNPADPDPEHKPAGGYFVPTWDFGTIPQGQSATRQLTFVVVPPGLQPTDPRYVAIVASYNATNDILLNRSQSLKISTWIDDIALDLGAQMEEPPPLRLSDVSVFHNWFEEEEEQLDFGDAPDPAFPTLLINDGARHVIVPGIFLGALIDAETNGQPNATATGDDLANLADEDGVTFLNNWVAGQVATVQVVAATSGYLHAWVDFNTNGTWIEANENVFGIQALAAGTNVLTFAVPGTAAIGPTFARFRFCTVQAPLGFTGSATDGEIEDYRSAILEEEVDLDFGDAPDPTYQTLLASDGARHVVMPGIYLGVLIDSEADGQPNATATGDDLANLADEDGVTFLNGWVAGQVATVQVVAATSGIVSAWVDFDANGSWGDFGENVLAGAPVVVGTNIMVVNVPTSSNTVSTFARFRYTTRPVAMTYTGLVANGEVEDYALSILPAEEEALDFGDADDSPLAPIYPTLLANNGARHAVVPGVFLGATVDAEPDGQPDGTATGDDSNPPAGLDDEDGVALPAVLVAGSSAPVPVVASVPGFLNAWIDWNGNGTWSDPGEQVFVNHPLVPGPNPVLLSAPLPPAFVSGGPQSRWRFTTYPPAAPAFTGAETDGEVEDYEVRLQVLDFGDAPDPAYPTLLANDGARHLIPPAPVYYLGATAPDFDPDGQPTAAAAGDDLNGVNDEDGVSVPSGAPLVRDDASAALVVNCSTTDGYLNAWLDFDGNGSWADAGERIAADRAMPAGFSALVFSIPAGARVGPTIGRFRFASGTGLTYTGYAADGEVEDHEFTIYQQAPDTNTFWITNVAHTATNEITIEWTGDTNAVYETQYVLDLPSTASPPWTAWGAWVSAPPLRQRDTNATTTAKHYRVVAPFSPPPP